MERARARIKALTGPSQVGMELEEVISRLDLFLRGRGHSLCTQQRSSSRRNRWACWRLFHLMWKKRGRTLPAGQADRWTSAWFHDQGLHKLIGTIRYPRQRNHVQSDRR